MITRFDKFSDIINQNRLLSSVIERLGVDEHCYDKTIQEVSIEINTDADFVVEILKAFDENNQPNIKVLSKFPIQYILDYLQKTHGYYLNKRLPEIEQSLHDLIRMHHNTDPMLIMLGNLFITYKRKLTEHIESEESILFPYINFLISQLRDDFNYHQSNQQLEKFSIIGFEESHEDVEADIAYTKETIIRYSPQQTSALSYRIFLNQLDLFEKDLHRHSIIEDKVLLPKALLLEKLVEGLKLQYESSGK
jgi:regulator of cell morphogenesis and NO signaling